MTTTERPVVLPGMQSAVSGWRLIGFAFSASAIGTGIIAGVGTAMGSAPPWVGLGMAPLLIGAGALGLWRLMRRLTRGLTAPQLLLHLQNERSLLVYRIFMPVSLSMLALGIGLSVAHPAQPSSLVMTGAMFSCLWGGLEWFRRSARRRARILFTLYAEGLLEPAETAAVDAERRQSPAFDAAVRDFQRWNAAVAELSRVESGR
ncbi:MAG: hypothetical protein WAT39_08385 [Planctomycetota bacterium]